MLQTEGLGHKFRVHQSAGAGLDGEVLLAWGSALGFNALAHLRDLRFPLRQTALGEIREARSHLLELFAEWTIAGDGAAAGQGLELPELRAALIVAFVRAQRVYQQSLLAIGPQARVGD